MKHTLIFHTIGLAKQLQKIIGFKITLDLSYSQATALLVIESEKNINQAEIAARLRLEPASVVTLVDELEKLKLLRRATLNGDRRKYNLQLTELGKEKAREIRNLTSKLDNYIRSKLSSSEAENFMLMLEKLFNVTEDLRRGVKNESFSSKRPLAV